MTEEQLQRLYQFLSCAEEQSHFPEYDLALVFGSHSPFPAKVAAQAYRKNLVGTIVVSGHGPRANERSPHLPHGFATEADFQAHTLVEHGVDRAHIVRETSATNTLQNVVYGMAAARLLGLPARRVLLCSVPPLARRALATMTRQQPDTWAAPAATHDYDEERARWLNDDDRRKRLRAELPRLISYAQKGHIAHVPLPKEIAELA